MLPPEINSALMYSGPGSGPLSAAAVAWDELAVELHFVAGSYRAVVSGLTAGAWLGGSSVSMAAAAAPYAAWLDATAALAEQTAARARMASAAYETAFSATVPPAVIAANRGLLTTLVATNVLGQNATAIAAVESQYAQMWAQDATVMYGYAGASASATTLAPFTSPPTSADPGGVAAEGTTGTSTATSAQRVLTQLASAVPTVLSDLATPLQSGTPATAALGGLGGVLDALGILGITPLGTPLGGVGTGITSAAWASASLASTAGQDARLHIIDVGDRILNRIDEFETRSQMGSADLAAGAGRPVAAVVGQALPFGGLSVPTSWATTAPAIRTLTAALSTAGLGSASAGLVAGPGNLLSEIALASVAGRAMGAATTAPARSPSAHGPATSPADPLSQTALVGLIERALAGGTPGIRSAVMSRPPAAG